MTRIQLILCASLLLVILLGPLGCQGADGNKPSDSEGTRRELEKLNKERQEEWKKRK